MKKLFSFLIALFFLLLPLYAQREVKGSLTGYIYPIIDNMPGRDGGEYAAPSSEALTRWMHLTDALLAGNYRATDSLAALVGYDLVHLQDTLFAKEYMILQQQEGSSNFWGTYVMRTGPYSLKGDLLPGRVVLQAPHPRYDLNTGKEAVYVMQHTDAFFCCLAGTHRCNSPYFSSCSGTTTACNTSSQPYRISDMAHNILTVFQTITELLAGEDTSLIFIQLHGFAMRDGDPYVIMSNGTRLTPNPDYLVALRDALHEEDPVLDFKVAHIDTDWNRLVAFNNVQGRYLNGSADACKEDAVTVSGRFIHIEQEKSRLREDSTKWDKMARAVHKVFDGTSGIAGPQTTRGRVVVSPNPFGERAVITFPSDGHHPFTATLINTQGRVVWKRKDITQGHFRFSRGTLPRGVYFLLLEVNGTREFTAKLVIE